jgi:hypothetical protein
MKVPWATLDVSRIENSASFVIEAGRLSVASWKIASCGANRREVVPVDRAKIVQACLLLTLKTLVLDPRCLRT